MGKHDSEQSLGKLGLKFGFYYQAQLEECLALQARRQSKDRFDRLGDILLEKGYITEEQLEILLSKQRDATEDRNRIGNFELVEEIGRGAMGIVYKARQMALDREVALKVILKGVGQDKAFRERFLRESRLAAQLSHPNIIKAIDAGETQQYFYFAMELFESPDLIKVLKKNLTGLEEQTVAQIGLQMARALVHATEHDLVHRDIKPENILYNEETGQAKLTDLGLAKSTADDQANLTQDGSTLGTPYYIAPEAIKAKKTADIRGDIYSLGATLYHLITGRVPFDGETVFVILQKHASEKLVSPKSRKPKVTQAMNRIIVKCMARNPAKRYQTPEELVEEFERLIRLGPEEAFEKSKAASAVRRSQEKKPLPLGLIGGVAAAVLAVAVVAAVVLSGGDGAQKNKGRGKGSGQAKAGKSSKSPKDDSDGAPPLPAPPPDDVPTPSKDKDWEEFESIKRFGAGNPDEFDQVLVRLRDLAERTADSRLAQRCREKVSQWETARHKARKASIQRRIEEATALKNEEKFGPAINVINELSTKLPEGDDLEQVKKLKEEFWNAARAKLRESLTLARRLARKGDYASAVDRLKRVESFGLPTLWEEARFQVEVYQHRAREFEAAAFHRSVVETSAREGFEAARGALENPPSGRGGDVPFEKDGLDRAARRAKSLRSYIEEQTGRKVILPLLQGGEARGTVLNLEGGQVWLKSEGGRRQGVHVKDVDPALVRGAADVSVYAEVCYLWYGFGFLQGLRAHTLLSTVSPDRVPRAEELARKMGTLISLELVESVEDLSGGPVDKVFRRSLDLIRRFRHTPFYDKVEGRLEALFSEAARVKREDAQILLAFHAPVEKLGDQAVRVKFDFTRSCELHSFQTEGVGRWVLRAGSLHQGEEATDSQMMLNPNWSAVRMTVRLRCGDPALGVGLLFESDKGLRYMLEISGTDRKISLRLLAGKKGEEKPVGRPMALPKSLFESREQDLELGLAVTQDHVQGEYTLKGKTRRTTKAARKSLKDQAGSGKIGMATRCKADFPEARVEGTLDTAWIESLRKAGLLKTLFAAGKWAVLLEDRKTLARFSTAGKVEVQGDVASLSGDRADLTLLRARQILGRGMGLQCKFSARRKSDMGWGGIRFFMGERDLVWVLKSEQEETPPYGVSEDHAVCSQGPFEDGEWHDVQLDITDGSARIFIDGTLREEYDVDMLVDLQGEVKTEGFGLSAFGGKWDFKEYRVRKLK